MKAEQSRVDEIQGDIVHVYDGIEEADNELPKWWLLTFYGAIIFGVGYWFAYHEFKVVDLPTEAYLAEVESLAGAGEEPTAEYLETIAADPGQMKDGAEVFAQNCVACHEPQGQGKIGPNLTDDYWLHGGGIMDIYNVVANGILEKGMPSWKGPLGAKRTRLVAAYVTTMRGKNVPGKEPQGTLWTGNDVDAGQSGSDGGTPDAASAESDGDAARDPNADTAIATPTRNE